MLIMKSFYQNLKSNMKSSIARLGNLSSLPARWIDNIHLKQTTSWFSKTLDFVSTRLIFIAFFPVFAVADVIFNVGYSLFAKTRALLSKNASSKATLNIQASESFDLAVKNMLAFLASLIGFFNPQLVSFYFIPKEKNQNNIVSGGGLYHQTTSIEAPKNEQALIRILEEANQSNKTISVIGAGRSQGKQFLPADEKSIAIDMSHFNHIKINAKEKTAIVGAGATWGDLQVAANPLQLAVKVMQASNVFSIGGSIGTNIHGWNKTGTIANTIRAIRIINARGEIQKLTPKDELFAYVVGGFGQFGIILDAEIELADNQSLVERSIVVKPENYVDYFKKNVEKNNEKKMHLYRLSIDPKNLLGEGIAVNYEEIPATQNATTKDFSKEPIHGTRLERILVNFARRFPFFRKFIWMYEKNRLLKNETLTTTNEIMHPPINAMFNNSKSESEWLQEYFIPGENLDSFRKALGELLTKNKVPLINATVRYVKQDKISKMGYANQGDRFAIVLCFNQSLKAHEVIKAKKWIKESIDLTLAHGGAYYLPYQAVASNEQFEKSYPTYDEVAQKKQEIDPEGRFKSGFSTQYFKKEVNFYKAIFQSPRLKAEFGKFLDNVLQRVDKDKLFALMDDILSYADSNEDIYCELHKRISEVMPSFIGSATRILSSLSDIKHDLGQQVATLMQDKSNKVDTINGLVEIGYPGRFIGTLRKNHKIAGTVTVINDQESLTDYIQTGFPRPYDQFLPINDYAPFDSEKLKDNSVDMVTCFIGLHHIPEDKMDGFLKSIRRILRPGGSFMLVDHDVRSEKDRAMANMAHSIYNAVMGVSLQEEKGEVRNFHSLAHWNKLLEKYGFGKIVCDQTMQRAGDPSKNTMMRFINHKPAVSKAIQAAEISDLIREKARTVLHAQEKFKMQSRNAKKFEKNNKIETRTSRKQRTSCSA
ncbi:FAD-binding protein [Candidatus Berkiella cookevillensis]|uniref:FAD-binding protein n=1 Tax=Candidatus Berkiella cookevillensis TaxID=437022 RepID=A0A0Q9YFW7_9GAMM|nr:FAD-binding protein [Candidatus Berkiella cookevillensis]MCS5707900.1 FAD-binding protein [Candidatus Berkiella cookevillensis]